MRPCAFMIFFYAFTAGKGSQLPRRKCEKDGGHQGK